jgi:hypothetical protein
VNPQIPGGKDRIHQYENNAKKYGGSIESFYPHQMPGHKDRQGADCKDHRRDGVLCCKNDENTSNQSDQRHGNEQVKNPGDALNIRIDFV